MDSDLLSYVDDQEQQRVRVKLAAHAAALRESVAMQIDEKIKISGAQFTREAGERIIRKAWASIGREPPPGPVLISPWLFAYAQREAKRMGVHIESRKRETERNRPDPH